MEITEVLIHFLKHEGKWRWRGWARETFTRSYFKHATSLPGCTGPSLVFHVDTEVLSEAFPHDLFSVFLDFSWEGKGNSFEITCYSRQDHLLLYESFVYP